MGIINPYAGMNWATKHTVMSFSHGHCTTQDHFNNYISAGYRHIPISNYHPSKPIGADAFQEFLTANGTSDTVIYSPNCELGYSTVGRGGTFSYYVHYCPIGSIYESGTDEEEIANRWTWRTQFQKMFAGLVYKDGGGITLNHPGWTIANHSGYETMDADKLFDWFMGMLDYDDRVLGVEIINGGGYRYDYGSHDVDFWDRILLTGRRCWCFCTPDWDATIRKENCKGRNMLLVDSVTEHECLKAYRKGQFYGKSGTTNLSIGNVSYDENTRRYHVEMPNAEQIAVVVDGVYTTFDSSSADLIVPDNAVYVRAEGYKEDSSDVETNRDEVYTQAITLRPHMNRKPCMDILMMK